jgi:hypothetical protein
MAESRGFGKGACHAARASWRPADSHRQVRVAHVCHARPLILASDVLGLFGGLSPESLKIRGRLGELIAEQRATVGLATGGRVRFTGGSELAPPVQVPTLAAATMKASTQWPRQSEDWRG